VLGVAIGKFFPPHRGHKHLIDVASTQVERLVVIVCSKPADTIPGELRASWHREIHPDVEVIRIDDVYDPEDSAVWAANTTGWLGRAPDVAFTIRTSMHDLFITRLREAGRPFTVIRGSREERVEAAAATIDDSPDRSQCVFQETFRQ
jgi:cytidyltransferase-like protein